MFLSRLAFSFLLVFSINSVSNAQTNLEKLLKERAVLYKDYEFYEKQKSSFWGTKSKKDLKNIIVILRRIIVKDSEIIKEINVQSLQKNAKVLSKTHVSQDWAYELENENNKLKILLKQTTFDYNELRSEMENMESAEKGKNTLLFILIVCVAGLILYVLKLRQFLKLSSN